MCTQLDQTNHLSLKQSRWLDPSINWKTNHIMLTKTKNKTSTILALKHHLGLEHFHKSTIKTHEELEHFCNTSIKTIIFLEGLRKDHQKLVQKSYHHWLSTISKVSTTFFTIFFSNLLPFVFIYVKKQREKKV